MVHVLSVQALCISEGWADMGLLLAVSLLVKLSFAQSGSHSSRGQ